MNRGGQLLTSSQTVRPLSFVTSTGQGRSDWHESISRRRKAHMRPLCSPSRERPHSRLLVATQSHWRLTNSQSAWHRSSPTDRKSTRLNSSHVAISYAVFCLKKKSKRVSRRSLRISRHS